MVFDPEASVYCREFLIADGMTWQDIPHGLNAVFYEFTAGEARGIFSRVEHSPYPRGYSEETPWEAAHCSIWPNVGDSRNNVKRAAKRLARLGRFTNMNPRTGNLTTPSAMLRATP